MRLLIIVDTFPPARISGALQMRDLASALARQGHDSLVLTPECRDYTRGSLEQMEGFQVLRVRAPRTKDVSYLRRTIAELVLPLYLWIGLARSEFANERWDGVIWYSPSIFFGLLVKLLRRKHHCRTYLVLRDLFPDWAVDAGVLRAGGVSHRMLKMVERVQYRAADVIGVQTPSNIPLVSRDAPSKSRIEVLHNWLAPVDSGFASFPTLEHLEGRTIFVYAGNMGVAQDVGPFVELARRMESRSDMGFLFVGRGSEAAQLKAISRGVSNVCFMDEVSPDAVSAILARCHVGIIALHWSHLTHNIPGKLLTYLHAGLPVLCRVNPSNDLVKLIESEEIGLVVKGDMPALLDSSARWLADRPESRAAMGLRGRALSQRMFSPDAAASQIVEGLRVEDPKGRPAAPD